jgi:beta-glucanase (GH16 family)
VAIFACLVVSAGIVVALIASAAPGCADSGPCVNAGTPVARQSWSPAFDDEFNGTVLDPGKWQSGRFGATSTADAPYNPGIEGAYFSSAGVQVTGGTLNLTLTPSVRTIDGVTYAYGSGEVNTNGRFYLKPGMYVEARVKVPRCDGCWPAFWAVPKTQYPPELDVFEYFDTSVPGHSRPEFNFHAPGGGVTGPSPYGQTDKDYRGGFHVYGMYWTGAAAVPYLDGRPYDVGVRATTSLPEYLILNLSLYANNAPPAGTRMSVDWVRVWKPSGGP